MLALQPDRMNSRQFQDPALPFGYVADAREQGGLPKAPPAPPSGAPLLSEHETLNLQNWLGNVADDRLYPDSYGEGMSFEVLDLAPELLGSSTSYGREPDLLGSSPNVHPYHYMQSAHEMSSSTMPGDLNGMPPPPPPPPLHQRQGLNGRPTPDVVAAASLLQHGPGGSHAANNHYHQGLDFGSLGDMGLMGSMGLGQHANQLLSGGQGPSNDHHFSGNHVGQQNHPQQAPHPQRRLPKMNWGSDTSFDQPQGFVGQAASESTEAMQQGQTKFLDCLHVSHSASTTRPSSPTTGHASPNKTQSRRASDFAVDIQDVDAPPRKRRKSRGKEEPTSPSSAGTIPAVGMASRRRRPTADTDASPMADDGRRGSNGSVETTTPRQRRRKSSSGEKKPPRENLSEVQKRENHIKSEQKRRTIIKEGFAEISAIVPKLRGGGYSKSNMLLAAADFLEKLINSNTVLHEELAKMGT